jgi:hypothetical protein
VTISERASHDIYPVSEYRLNYVLREAGLSFRSLLNPLLNISAVYQPLAIGILFLISCTLSGFAAITYKLTDKPNIKKSYVYIREIKKRKVKKENFTELSDNIILAKYGPNLLGGPSRLAFGLCTLILKTQASLSCRQLRDRCIIAKNDKYATEFAQNIEVEENKISDLIPEKQTILVAIGLLTTLGISFAFNMGVILPLPLSIAALYVFLNIGAVFYFTGKSIYIGLPLILFLIFLVAMSYQTAVTLIWTIFSA